MMRSSPIVHVWDGMPLPPPDFPVPESSQTVLTRAADHLGVDPGDPRSRKHLDRWYFRVSRRHVIPRTLLRPEGISALDAAHHPRGLRFAADARTRILAQLIERPDWVAASWSAAALLGIPEFSHGADTCVYSHDGRKLTADPLLPTHRRCPAALVPWRLHLADHALLVSPPTDTLVQCLRSVLDHEHAWEVPALRGHAAETVRGVQVIDRFRRVFGVSPEEISRAAHHRLSRRRLSTLLRLSDRGADSPPETALRLLARPIAHRLNRDFLTQVPVYEDGHIGRPHEPLEPGRKLLTILDAADPELQVALMYDGDHHLRRGQRDRDARISARLSELGWFVIRVSAGMLRDTRAMEGRIERALRNASRCPVLPRRHHTRR